jgi:hypothetical protein
MATEVAFTLIEVLVATAMMATLMAAVFAMLNPARETFDAQLEHEDVLQRMRVGVDGLHKDLIMAGAGTYIGPTAAPLRDAFAPVMPYRFGESNADPPKGIFYRTDTISVVFVPSTASQATIRDFLLPGSRDLRINAAPNCPPDTMASVCGFTGGMQVALFDGSGNWDALSVVSASAGVLYVEHAGDLSSAYPAGSAISAIAMHTYYLKSDKTSSTVMHYDGRRTDMPVVDNVVSLRFDYFGDAQPPRVLAGSSTTDPNRAHVTYGPRPPIVNVDDSSDSWAAGENCTTQIVNGVQVPRLSVLGDGFTQVVLTPSALQDGPWCPDETRSSRYDADLLRIRRVAVTLRVQAAVAWLRGPTGALFTRGGTARSGSRFVPDREIRFDVAPRNLNLMR